MNMFRYRQQIKQDLREASRSNGILFVKMDPGELDNDTITKISIWIDDERGNARLTAEDRVNSFVSEYGGRKFSTNIEGDYAAVNRRCTELVEAFQNFRKRYPKAHFCADVLSNIEDIAERVHRMEVVLGFKMAAWPHCFLTLKISTPITLFSRCLDRGNVPS